MSFESEVASQVYRMRELHEHFSNGLYEEMNALYSDEFQGWLYLPSTGKLELMMPIKLKREIKNQLSIIKEKGFNLFIPD